MNKRPLIFLTNDDGIKANGLRMLHDIASELGDIVVLCPEDQKSGCGGSITIKKLIKVNEDSMINGFKDNVWSCNGTPADCACIGICGELFGRKPDIVLSGINQGANYGRTAVYSGTIGAAIRASILGVPAIAFSYANTLDINEKHVMKFKDEIISIIKEVLDGENVYPDTILSINIPDMEPAGIRNSRQSYCHFEIGVRKIDDNAFILGTTEDPMFGECSEGDDLHSLNEGFISVSHINIGPENRISRFSV